MAGRTPISPVTVSRFATITATSPSVTAADTTNGNLSPNDGYSLLEMTNASGVSRTVTLVIPGGVDDDLLAPNRVYTMASNGVYFAGVFPISVYGAQLLYTASGAGVSFRVLSMRGNV